MCRLSVRDRALLRNRRRVISDVSSALAQIKEVNLKLGWNDRICSVTLLFLEYKKEKGVFKVCI